MPQLTDFLPTTRKEMELLGWDEVDVVLFSGDAYVDHPSFGAAVIGRILEAEGLRVAIVPQPNWRDDLRDFRKMGRPRLFFGVTAGCMDSMVNKYTANKRLRSEDAYTPDGRHDLRPEYPSVVYTQILKRLYPDVPVVLGGIEASMRRLTHYDYWQDGLRRSILCDSGADILVYGMGEKPIVAIARQLQQNEIENENTLINKNLNIYGEEAISFEAEHVHLVNSRGVISNNEMQSYLTTPNSYTKNLLNVLGGANWKAPNTSVVWKVKVPKTALYRISFRFKKLAVSKLQNRLRHFYRNWCVFCRKFLCLKPLFFWAAFF